MQGHTFRLLKLTAALSCDPTPRFYQNQEHPFLSTTRIIKGVTTSRRPGSNANNKICLWDVGMGGRFFCSPSDLLQKVPPSLSGESVFPPKDEWNNFPSHLARRISFPFIWFCSLASWKQYFSDLITNYSTFVPVRHWKRWSEFTDHFLRKKKKI